MSEQLIEQLQRRLKEAEEQVKEAEEQVKKAEEQVKKTTLEGYLRDCHQTLKALQIADKSVTATGHATEVDGKRYPKWLRHWDDFADAQRGRHFDTIVEVFGDKRLFPPSIATLDRIDDACPFPAATENDICRFERIAVESPARRILNKLPEIEPRVRQDFNFAELQFSNNNHELKRQDDVCHDDDEGQSEGVPAQQDVQRPASPDGRGQRRHPQGHENVAFVFDYKAAHELANEDLKAALAKETLFMEVVQRTNGSTTKTDTELKERDDADARVAMALVRVFDSMVERGVAFGYVATGKALVFLHVKRDDLQTLYCHQCIPTEDEDEEGGFDVSHTAVAQLASFCLLALRSEDLQGLSLDRALERAKTVLEIWPEAYDEAEELLKVEPLDPRTAEMSAANKRKEGSSSGGSGEEDHKITSDSDSPPTRKYCTQACFLGLKRGWDLDEACPNVSAHRTVESGSRHPIDASGLASMVEQRLRQSPYRDCAAVDPYGLMGKIGAIGGLFKLELTPYGYTFVAKGTQSAHLHCLQHESLVYSRLERLQGDVVPVHLGLVTLAGGYALPGGARVVCMMLLSWAGEVAAGADVSDLAAERRRSLQAVWGEGVDHGDEREVNVLWNEERRRVMVIDFDRATLRPAAKHKQLSRLYKIGKKKKGEKISLG